MDGNFETISGLEEQILNEQDERELAEEKLERRIQELESQAENDENRANLKIRDLENRLDLLKEFSDNRDQYVQKQEALEAELEQQKETSKRELQEMEMKFIKERRENKEEMKAKIEEVRRDYLNRVDASLDEKTREILLENLRLKDDMKLQERESRAVLGLNSNIIEQDRQLRNEYELAQSAEAELSNKLGLYQHLIRQLNDRNIELENQVEELTVKYDELIAMSEDADRKPREGSHSVEDTYLDFLNVLSSHYNTKIGQERKIETVSKKEVDTVICSAFEVIARKFPNRFMELLKKRGDTLKLPKISNSAKTNTMSPSRSNSANLIIASSNVSYSPQKWWEGDARRSSVDISYSTNNKSNSSENSGGKKTKSVAIQTDKDESVVEISDLKNFIILGDEARKGIKTNPLRPQELDIITGGTGLDDSASVPTRMTDLSDELSASENSSRNAKMSVKSENAKHGRKYRQYKKPPPLIGGGTLVLDPNYVDTPPTFLSGSDSASRLRSLQLNLNTVGKSIGGSVNMTPSPSKRKTPGSSIMRRTPVETIPGSPPMGMSRGGISNELKGQSHCVDDSEPDSGRISPSSAVSMSPRLEALQ